MKTLLAVVALLSFAGAARAADAEGPLGPKAGQLGVGVLLGDPTSASLKYWLDGKSALDFGLGVSNNLVLHGDYQYHGWGLVGQPKKGRLAAYMGVGWRLELEDHDDFGIRLVPGLSYWPKFKRPVEFFVELGPVIRLTDRARVLVDGGFGLRYYFEPIR